MSFTRKTGLVGVRAEVIAPCNAALCGLAGVVVDETASSLVLETSRGRKRVIKSHASFLIDGNAVEGSRILGLPDERMMSKVD